MSFILVIFLELISFLSNRYLFFLLTAALLVYYGLQHYLSMAGSLIFIPLIIVPAMGGTDVSIVSHGYHAVFYNTGQELA
jgi:nucleobase transporter 1/2